MDQAERIARVRAALDTAKRLLGAHIGRGADLAVHAEVATRLGVLERLLAQLEGGEELSGRAEGTSDTRPADVCPVLLGE